MNRLKPSIRFMILALLFFISGPVLGEPPDLLGGGTPGGPSIGWPGRYATANNMTGGAVTVALCMGAPYVGAVVNDATEECGLGYPYPRDEQGHIPRDWDHPFRSGYGNTGIVGLLIGDANYLSDIPGYWIYQATGYNIKDKWFYGWMP